MSTRLAPRITLPPYPVSLHPILSPRRTLAKMASISPYNLGRGGREGGREGGSDLFVYVTHPRSTHFWMHWSAVSCEVTLKCLK